MKFVAVDLFAGAGGITEGFKWAGFDVAASLELDHDACETHKINHPDTVVIEGDITKPPVKAALTKAIKRKKIDIIVGGPPCQGFSLVGTRLGTNKALGRFIDDPRNLLYKEFVKIVKKHNPRIFLMENVPGLFSYKKGLIKKQICSDFRKLGYKVDVDILNAADYGVPQIRKRVIFIGNRLGVRNIFPLSTHFNHNDLKSWEERYSHETLFKLPLPPEFKDKSPYVTVRDAISDLPTLRAGEGVNSRVNYAAPPKSDYQEFMRIPEVFTGDFRKNVKRAHANTDGVYNHQCRNHNPLDIRRYKTLDEGQIFADLPSELRNGIMPKHFRDKYRKLDSARPSYTIVAHLYKDGNAFVHPDRKQGRTLTVREAARIQSFPDNFFFCNSRTSQFKQVGNALPPIMAHHLALAVRKMLSFRY